MEVFFTLSKEGKHVNINTITDIDMSIFNKRFGNFYSKILKKFQDQHFCNFEILCFLRDGKDKIFVCDLISLQNKNIQEDSYAVLEVFFQQYLEETAVFELSVEDYTETKNFSSSKIQTKKHPNFSISEIKDFNIQKILSIQEFLGNSWMYSGDNQNAYLEIINTLSYVYLKIKNMHKTVYNNRSEEFDFIFKKILNIMNIFCFINLNEPCRSELVSLFLEVQKNEIFTSEFNIVFMNISKYFNSEDWSKIVLNDTPSFNHYDIKSCVTKIARMSLDLEIFYNYLDSLKFENNDSNNPYFFDPMREFKAIAFTQISNMEKIPKDLLDSIAKKNLHLYKKIGKIENSEKILDVIKNTIQNKEEFSSLWFIQALLFLIHCKEVDITASLYHLEKHLISKAFLKEIINVAYDDYQKYSYGRPCDLEGPLSDIFFSLTDSEYYDVKNSDKKEKYIESFKNQIHSFIVDAIKENPNLGFSLIFFDDQLDKYNYLKYFQNNYYYNLFTKILFEIKKEKKIKDEFMQRLDNVAEKIIKIDANWGNQNYIRNPVCNILKTSGLYEEEKGKKILSKLLDYYEKYYDNIQEWYGGILDIAKDEEFIRNNKDFLLELWSRFNLKTNFRNELAKSSVLPEEIYDNLAKSKSDDIIFFLLSKEKMEII